MTGGSTVLSLKFSLQPLTRTAPDIFRFALELAWFMTITSTLLLVHALGVPGPSK
jgi:hypothetical protein